MRKTKVELDAAGLYLSPFFPWSDDLRRNYSGWLILLCPRERKTPWNGQYTYTETYRWTPEHCDRLRLNTFSTPGCKGGMQGSLGKGTRILSACVFIDFAFSGNHGAFLPATRFICCLNPHDRHVPMILRFRFIKSAINTRQCACYRSFHTQQRLS